METEITILIECEGDFVRGKASFFDPRFGNWLPGEHDDVDNFKVFISKGLERLEITKMLTEAELDSLKEQFLHQRRAG